MHLLEEVRQKLGAANSLLAAKILGSLARALAAGGSGGRIGPWLQRAAGALFIGLGVRLALAER